MRVQPSRTGRFTGSVSQYHAPAGTLSARGKAHHTERVRLTPDGPAPRLAEPRHGPLVPGADIARLVDVDAHLLDQGVDRVEAERAAQPDARSRSRRAGRTGPGRCGRARTPPPCGPGRRTSGWCRSRSRRASGSSPRRPRPGWRASPRRCRRRGSRCAAATRRSRSGSRAGGRAGDRGRPRPRRGAGGRAAFAASATSPAASSALMAVEEIVTSSSTSSGSPSTV